MCLSLGLNENFYQLCILVLCAFRDRIVYLCIYSVDVYTPFQPLWQKLKILFDIAQHKASIIQENIVLLDFKTMSISLDIHLTTKIKFYLYNKIHNWAAFRLTAYYLTGLINHLPTSTYYFRKNGVPLVQILNED